MNNFFNKYFFHTRNIFYEQIYFSPQISPHYWINIQYRGGGHASTVYQTVYQSIHSHKSPNLCRDIAPSGKAEESYTSIFQLTKSHNSCTVFMLIQRCPYLIIINNPKSLTSIQLTTGGWKNGRMNGRKDNAKKTIPFSPGIITL